MLIALICGDRFHPASLEVSVRPFGHNVQNVTLLWPHFSDPNVTYVFMQLVYVVVIEFDTEESRLCTVEVSRQERAQGIDCLC